MKIVAIDQATVLGFATGCTGSTPRWGSIRLQGDTTGEILADFRRFLVTMCREQKPDLVVFEQPIFPRMAFNMATLLRLIAMAGFIEEVCVVHGVKCRQVSSAEVSSFLLLRGRMKRAEKKLATLRVLRDQYGFDLGLDNDAGDALGIWLKAEAVMEPTVAGRRGIGPLQLGKALIMSDGKGR